MKYFEYDFEKLDVYQLALELYGKFLRILKRFPREVQYSIGNQLLRAALSISNNIAEGFERGSTAELLAFLYISRGSCGETRSMLLFTERFDQAAHLKSQISQLKSLAESCSRQIRAWANNLQNSDIKGQRHLTDTSKAQYEFQRSADVFTRHIDEIVRRARPQDYPEDEE